MALNRRLGWLPSTQNNTAVLFGDYEESIQAKADLVRTAERFVHVEYFMMCRDCDVGDRSSPRCWRSPRGG